MIYKPVPDKVLIKPVSAKEVTEGGIIIPEMAKGKTGIAHIVSVVADNEEKLTEGERILYAKNAGVPYKEDGVEYLIVSIDHIFSKI